MRSTHTFYVMTINIKDNVEFAASCLWFYQNPWFKSLEKDSPYIFTIQEYFRMTIGMLGGEIESQEQVERYEKEFLDAIGEDVDYLLMCALGDFLTKNKGKSEARTMLPHFAALYTHWLDWAIHRRGQDAMKNYGIIAPSKIADNQKEKWAKWVLTCEAHREENKDMNDYFDQLIDSESSIFLKILRVYQQNQNKVIMLLSKDAPSDPQ